MKKRIKIEVRAAELADVEALTRIYADRNAYSQTLQLPFQSLEVWRKRLTTNDDTQVTLVAAVAGEVVGNLGLTRFTRPRRAHVGEIGMGVRDDWQGKGVGSALMQAALELADNWLGCAGSSCTCTPTTTGPSHSIASSASSSRAPTAPTPSATASTWTRCPWRA